MPTEFIHTLLPSGSGGPAPWQRHLAAAVRDPAELLALLELDPALLPAARRAAASFPLRVPRGFVGRMRPGDPDDPLLRQVLPLGAETEPSEGFDDDPVGDTAAMAGGGVLHKYRGRALLVATGACAVHCRYCFRRHFPYAGANASADAWDGTIDYLQRHADIREVILSGGDPLTLSDRRLADLVRRLESVGHLARLRIHSRLPVVLPERIDDTLLGWLTASRLTPVMVIHANHARELDQAVEQAVRRLVGAGVTVLNQAVLLYGVNDSVEAQVDLNERLFEIGALPYYLHLLDRVRGAAHFEVDLKRARALHQAVTNRLPGYLVPRLVREDAGEPAKTRLG